jgi:hypothetical protein
MEEGKGRGKEEGGGREEGEGRERGERGIGGGIKPQHRNLTTG